MISDDGTTPVVAVLREAPTTTTTTTTTTSAISTTSTSTSPSPSSTLDVPTRSITPPVRSITPELTLPSCIIPGLLYLGSMYDAHNAEALDACNIKLVINMAKEVRAAHRDRYIIRRYDLDDEAHQSIAHTFQDIFTKIDEAKEEGYAVLVHCMAGVSRSATVVIAYCMTRLKLSLKESFAYVRERRDVIAPNWGFVRQLQLYECKHYSLVESTMMIPGSAFSTGNRVNDILDGTDDEAATIS